MGRASRRILPNLTRLCETYAERLPVLAPVSGFHPKQTLVCGSNSGVTEKLYPRKAFGR